MSDSLLHKRPLTVLTILQTYVIDCQQMLVSVTTGAVQVTLTDAQGQNIPVKLIDSNDKTFRVEFEAPVAGVYTANVTFAGVATPGSPYKINVEAVPDVSKVQVRGLPQSKYGTSHTANSAMNVGGSLKY